MSGDELIHLHTPSALTSINETVVVLLVSTITVLGLLKLNGARARRGTVGVIAHLHSPEWADGSLEKLLQKQRAL